MMDEHFKGWREFLINEAWDPGDSANWKPQEGDPDWTGDDWGEMAKQAVRAPTPKRPDTVSYADPEIVQKLLNTMGMNSLQNHNFKLMANNERLREIVVEKYSISNAARQIGSLTHQIALMVAENDIFKQEKLLKYLGHGNFGVVFELENGHVLKISWGGYDSRFKRSDPTGTVDAEKHLKSQEDVFKTKSATKSTPMIYDHGAITFSNAADDLYYVEMPKLIPLDKIYTDSFELQSDFLRIKYSLLDYMFRNDGVRTKSFQATIRPDGKIELLSREHVESILAVATKAIKDAGSKSWRDAYEVIWDVKPANVGVLIQDPNTVVLFDY